MSKTINMELIRKLLADDSRSPIFAGRCQPGRTYLRDFVVCDEHVLAICNVDRVEEAYRPVFFSPAHDIREEWTILLDYFEPLDLMKMLGEAKMAVRLGNVTGALAAGNVYDSKHPNKLLPGRNSSSSTPIFFCNDCETIFPEHYMIHNELWNSVVQPVTQQCILCLDCLAKRLGRPLTIKDFKDVPINRAIFRAHEMGRRSVMF